MRTGNIVKTAYGDIVIITAVNDRNVSWVSASHANASGSTPQLTTEKFDDCDCTYDSFCPDIECPICKGIGRKLYVVNGMDKATVLADNMFDYIKSRMMKNFDF